MGYARDLDEYSEIELRTELTRRETARILGICDYCERKPTEPACRFPERHSVRSQCIHGIFPCPICRAQG